MSSGQWEVVIHNKRNRANKKQIKNGKSSQTPAAKVQDILPVPQAKNHSDASRFNKENKKPQDKELTPKKQPQKKSDNAKQKTPKSIDSALQSIDVEDLKTLLETSQRRFPDTPLVWLKELSSYLNSKINIDLPLDTTKAYNYPLCSVPTSLRQIMEKAYNEAGKPSQLFFDYLLNSMADDMVKGQIVIGHKLWLQFLANANPHVTVNQLEKHITLRDSHQSRQPIGVSILWALGQGGFKDLNLGLKVFKEVMVPVLQYKNYSKFIIKYLSQLVQRHENTKFSKDNILFLFDFVNARRNLQQEEKQELLNVHKKLKQVLSKITEQKCSDFFETFLDKLSITLPQLVQKDIFDILFTILNNDSSCYKIWKNMLSTHATQTYMFLKYISDHWRRLNSKINKKLFQQFLKFCISSKSNNSTEEIHALCQLIKRLYSNFMSLYQQQCNVTSELF